jgi:uncharacterized protein
MRNLMTKIAGGALVALFLCAADAAVPTLAMAQQQQASQTFATGSLTIRTAAGKSYPFTIEIAVTDPQREQGLMFRKEMADDHGMIFDFGQPRRVQMWMENTILPLDMLFIQGDGTISHIRENAVPYSRDIIDSRGDVKYVLEINGGRAKALGLKVGDKVIGKVLGNGV